MNKLELKGLESVEDEDEHLAQAESVAFEQLMASGRNLRSFKKDQTSLTPRAQSLILRLSWSLLS